MEAKRNWKESEFNKWKENWLREMGCPFFACSQVLYRKVCGNTYMCGVLFNYEMYKNRRWLKVCDVKLAQDDKGVLPTKVCPACTGSMCIKVSQNTGQLISKSWCKIMNDHFENMGYVVDRDLEQYIFSWGAFLVPIIGETAYLSLSSDPNKLSKLVAEYMKERGGEI